MSVHMCTDATKAGECRTRCKRRSEDDKQSPECKIFNPSWQPKVKHENSEQTQATKHEDKNTQKKKKQASRIQERNRTQDEKAEIQGHKANLARNTQWAGFKYTRIQVKHMSN